jgi:hypothetical protein
MNDEQFLQALEMCQLPASEFGQSDHVRAAYLYLRSHEFVVALEHLRRAIRNYAASLGKADRYHETITVAYLALIQQHICECGDGGGGRGSRGTIPNCSRGRCCCDSIRAHNWNRSSLAGCSYCPISCGQAERRQANLAAGNDSDCRLRFTAVAVGAAGTLRPIAVANWLDDAVARGHAPGSLG